MAHKVIGEDHMKITNGNGEAAQQCRKPYKSNTIFCDEDEQSGYVKFHGRISSCDVIMNSKYHNKKAFTLPL
eukprot:776600-Ditylum_brightwellii.AAC.1